MTTPSSTTGEQTRGTLKVYLGFAPGVGKTFQMLRDAHDAAQVGADVIIGYFEPHKREDTLALAQGLETIPLRQIIHRDRAFSEMDTATILNRKPQICLVDEFAHTNVPGAEREKRWEDVLVLLDAGISVWTTLNVQHIESLNDAVFEITGVRMRETVPDWALKQATEIQVVDVTPEALLNRLRRGAVYTGDMAQKAVESYFRESNLRALRELALREAAHEIQARHTESGTGMLEIVPTDASKSNTAAATSSERENLLVFVTLDPSTAMLIRRARRVADYLHAGCLALYVHQEHQFHEVPESEREAVERHLNFARNLRIETRILQGHDAATTLVEFARRNQVTQILLSRAILKLRPSFLGGNLVREVIRRAPDMQITVVADRGGENAEGPKASSS
ncbi:MAG: histidine kinase [Acidobacteria bacterium]|nr:histidine kinase [Acidobacteriota bacterium]